MYVVQVAMKILLIKKSKTSGHAILGLLFQTTQKAVSFC